MFLGLVAGIACWFVSKKILLSIIVFYIFTGIHKSRLWLAIPVGRRDAFLPPIISSFSFKSLIVGIVLWPIIILHGDPLNDFFKSLGTVRSTSVNKRDELVNNPEAEKMLGQNGTVRSASVNKWDELINSPEAEKMFDQMGIKNLPYIIGVVLRPMKINVFSFTSNLVWIYNNGNERAIQRSSDQALFHTYSPSIKYFTRPTDRPQLPLWYIAAFPDVIKWMNECPFEFEIFSKIYEGIDENEIDAATACGWEDNKAIAILKMMAINYRKNVKPYLETVI